MTSPSRGRTAVTRGVNAHKLATEGRMAHGTASLAERPSFPSVEATRAYLDALMCPFCNLGPFRYPLGHIASVHGFSSAETRAYLGVPRTHSFSDPDTRAANIAKGRGAPNLSIESRKKGAKAEKRNFYETEKQRKAKERRRRSASGPTLAAVSA